MFRKAVKTPPKSEADKRRIAGLANPQASAAAAIAFMMFAPTAYGSDATDLDAQHGSETFMILASDSSPVTGIVADLDAQHSPSSLLIQVSDSGPVAADIQDLDAQHGVGAVTILHSEEEASGPDLQA